MFQTCDLCEERVISLNDMKIDGVHYGICSNCSEGRNEEVQNNVLKTLSTKMWYRPVVVQLEGQSYTTLVNEHSELVRVEDLLLLSKHLMEFSNVQNISESIVNHNDSQTLHYGLSLHRNSEGLFEIPNDFVKVKLKEFNPEKRNWSFKCGNCNEKVGTSTHTNYYFIELSHQEAILLEDRDRACSKECASVIAKDMIIQNMPQKYKRLIAPLDDFKPLIQ